MSETIEGTGKCLCGSVQIMARKVNTAIIACHCDSCRNWGGGPMFSTACGSEVTFEGEENITIYNSSAWAERGFCKQCGTHLFYRIKSNQLHVVPVGLFDDESKFEFTRQVFIDEKPAFYHFGDETQMLTGAEVMGN